MHLQGRGAAERFVAATRHRVIRPLTDLLRAPGGPRERQLVHGEAFEVLETHEGHAFGWAARDGYVGYIAATALSGRLPEPSHAVAAPATHAYPAPDLKCPEICGLSFGTQVRVTSETGGFCQTAEGWFLPRPHLRPLDAPFADPVAVAELFLGVPYLWGGNSIRGIDCSGLIQTAFLACGRACPGDSDQQERALGGVLPPDSAYRRNDLIFWTGHVALVADPLTLIHANAHSMSVAREPIADALARIAATGGGAPTAHLRP
nr:NlpC/P60 family protein [Rhodovulum strictum]